MPQLSAALPLPQFTAPPCAKLRDSSEVPKRKINCPCAGVPVRHPRMIVGGKMVSKKLSSALVATTMILLLLGALGVAFAQAPAKSTTPARQILLSFDLPRTTNLSTFVDSLTKANLTNQLNESGNFTVFAQTNAAFSRMNGTPTLLWRTTRLHSGEFSNTTSSESRSMPSTSPEMGTSRR
jgi:hypothetical protein